MPLPPPAEDTAEPESDAERADDDSAADELVKRFAGASISPAAAPSAAVAMSLDVIAPSPARCFGAPAADPRTPATRGMSYGVAASPAAMPPSPAVEVRARAEALALAKKKVTCETGTGLGFTANVRARDALAACARP